MLNYNYCSTETKKYEIIINLQKGMTKIQKSILTNNFKTQFVTYFCNITYVFQKGKIEVTDKISYFSQIIIQTMPRVFFELGLYLNKN